ncbi:MAG: sulfurtransferase, partial [Anaerolineae bacterium]|nr:sulfurtransferase [Anaerolineae bacterium]
LRGEVEGVAFQALSPPLVAQVLGQIGVRGETTVVFYDAIRHLHAARALWTLECCGHPDVRVLNGGWTAWIGSELSTSRVVPQVEPVEYKISGRQPATAVDREWVLSHLHDPDVVMLDVRRLAEFHGEELRSKRGGHIPGARHIPWEESLDGDELLFRRRPGLERIYGSLNRDKTIMAYCQVGVRACVTYLALRLAGYTDVCVYDGSWQDWGNRDDCPVDQ